MLYYDKDDVKEFSSTQEIFRLVSEWGGEPIYTDFGFISKTICHNHDGGGSHKLYYYDNTKLFRCYTGCGEIFDIYDLYQKMHQGIENYGEIVEQVALKLGVTIAREKIIHSAELSDYFTDMNKRRKDMSIQTMELKPYNPKILQSFPKVYIQEWIDEGINKEAMTRNNIRYSIALNQIIIPHYDKNNSLVGIRARVLDKQLVEKIGKYKPIFYRNLLYTHPLGANLYNFNNTKENIRKTGKVIIFEGEKSCLKYASLFGLENDISVATCGMSLSKYQALLLSQMGVQEVIIAFDRQFKEHGDEESHRFINLLISISKKYGGLFNISFMFDKYNQLGYKDSPIDRGAQIFQDLYSNRVYI